MASEIFYPPSPVGVPPEITRLDVAYRGRVVAMIGGLFLFLLIYLAFIVLVGLCLLYTSPSPRDS